MILRCCRRWWRAGARTRFTVLGLAAVLGVGGLALSLAAQDTTADAIAGFIILVDGPFRMGDRIEIQGASTWGDVVEIGLRTARIRTLDNRMVSQRTRSIYKKMSKKGSEKEQAKERGGLLSAWLIFLVIHGVLAAYSIYYLRADQGPSALPWVFPTVFALGIADIVAGIAAWNWKRWGLQLYAIGTVVGIAVGLVLTGSQLWVFHELIPLVILGYLVKGKWDYFE